MLTVQDVADRTRLSTWTVYRAIHDGDLVAYKLRGQMRVHEADFDLWLEGTRVCPQPGVRPRGVVVALPPAQPAAGSFRDRTRRRDNG